METMHHATRLVIEQNMPQMTAFSARPDAPVLPATAPRPRRVSSSRVLRRLGAVGRSPVHPTAPSGVCT